MSNKNPLAYVRVIDKIKVPEQYHRGRKLLNEDKEEIKKLYQTGGYSYQKLADMYGVAYGTVQIIIKPEVKEQVKMAGEKWREKNKEYVKKMRKGKAMELRRYKKRLIEEGKIKLKKEKTK